MQNGKWIPISKYFADSLPKTRKFTELEAMYSLQLDYDKGNTVTVSGCSSRWGWSRSKVSKFFKDNEIVVNYPENTKKTKNQRGVIDIHPDEKRHIKRHKKSNKKTIKEHKRLIDSSWVKEEKDIKRAIKEHKKSNEKSTTRNNLLIPDPESLKKIPQNEFAGNGQTDFYMTKKNRKLNGKRFQSFILFWEAFGYKRGKAEATDSWLDIPELTDSLVDEICKAAKIEAQNRKSIVDKGMTPIFPQGWLSAKRWEDEQPAPNHPKNDESGKELLEEIESIKKKGTPMPEHLRKR